MHIPDGYLSPSTCAALGAVMLPVWYIAAKKMKKNFPPDQIPKLAMLSVFSLLIMMFNVPVTDGTTAHAIGATLSAILVGPWATVIAMSVALSIQALVFGDGGILAFGANTFNMAFIAPFLGYGMFVLLGGKRAPLCSKKRMITAAIAAYIGINGAALCVAFELGLQPLLFVASDGAPLYAPYPLFLSIPAMMIPHMTVIGIIEGVITALALRFVDSSEAAKVAHQKGVE